MSATLAVALGGCAGAPPLTVYGGLIDRCVETRASTDGYRALLGTTVVNESSRSVILREVRPDALINATVEAISVVPLHSAASGFGLAPGDELSAAQRSLWEGRRPVDGTVIGPQEAVSVVLQLRAVDTRAYAGIHGLHVKYDDGWFSTTSTGHGEVGFVPPWGRCSDR